MFPILKGDKKLILFTAHIELNLESMRWGGMRGADTECRLLCNSRILCTLVLYTMEVEYLQQTLIIVPIRSGTWKRFSCLFSMPWEIWKKSSVSDLSFSKEEMKLCIAEVFLVIDRFTYSIQFKIFILSRTLNTRIHRFVHVHIVSIRQVSKFE